MKEYNFTLLGQIPAKKNNYRFGKNRFYNAKQKELDEFILDLTNQRNNYDARDDFPIKTQCELNLELWQGDRTDLDNQITTICDLLQNSGIIANDRQIKHIIAHKVVENNKPIVHITLFDNIKL